MRTTLVLALGQLKRNASTLAILATLLFLFQILLSRFGLMFAADGTYETLASLVPDFVRRAAGFDVTILLRFEGSLAVGYIHPAVQAALAAAVIVLARAPVAERDSRSIELIAVRALRRYQIPAATLIAVYVVALALPAVMFAGTSTALALAGIDATPILRTCAALAVSDVCLLTALGSLCVLVAAYVERTRAYLQTTLAFVLLTYILDFLSRLWLPLAPLGRLSLLRYLNPGAILAGRSVASELTVLAVVSVVASVAALLVYERRDL